MFHREIIINYGELDTAKDALAYYIQALTGLQEGIREVWTALENGEGEAHDALMSRKELLSERISRELEAAEDTRSVLESYIADMTAIITPDIRGQRMLVDRNDIWGNMVTMEAQIGHLGAIDYFARVWAWETHTPHPDDKTRRQEEGYYKRVQSVKNDIILPYGARIAAIFEELQSIYDNQVRAYENMDDEYEYLTEANYRKHTDSWEIAYDDLASFCTGVWDFVVGFVQGAVDVVAGLMNVVIGLVCLLASGITWGVCELCGLDTPDWASDKLDQAGSTATALLEDPLLIVEGISQGATDAVEQKGICYCAGYLTGSIMADKGLSEGLLAMKSTSAVSSTGTISTTGKLSAEGMSHVDDVTRAGVRSLDDLDDLARAGAKTLDSVEDVVSPTFKTLDKVEDVSKPVVKTLDKVQDTSKPVVKTLDKVEDASKPVVKTLDKVEDASKPVVKTLDKVQDASKSVVKTLDQVEDASKPVVKTLDKVEDASKPVVKTLDQVEDVSKPVVKTLDKVEDASKPVVKTLDKVEDASKPVVKTLDQVEDASKPLAKVDDIPNPEINPLNDVGKKATDGVDSLDDLANAGRKKLLSGGGKYSLPQGISQEQFSSASKLLRDKVGNISDDIVVQGSRASGTAKATSDIDIALRVSSDKFDELINQYFKIPNPGSAKERTMLHAIQTGKIQSGEAKLKALRLQLQNIFGMDVDISVIKIGGPFDNPPFIPFE